MPTFDLADPRAFRWSVIGLFLFALLLRLSCFTGLIGSDDSVYADYANQIAQGQYKLEHHHFAIRFGLILPVGFVYWLFGLNEWSTIAVPLLSSSVSVVLLALIAIRLFGMQAGLIAGLIYATFPVGLRYATILVPEAVAEAYVLLAVLIFVWTEMRAQVAFGALAGAFIGIAYLTKEPTLFIAPALFLAAVFGRRWRQAFGVALGVTAILTLEHLYYLAMTGDLLFRSHAMVVHNQYVGGAQAGIQISNLISDRIFGAYPRMMLLPGVDFGIHSLGALILASIAWFRYRKDRRFYFLFLWAALPWLYLNFGSSSLTSYIPIPFAPRYIEFSYPPLFLMSAWLLSDLLAELDAWTARLISATIVVVMTSGIASGLLTRAIGYNTAKVAVLRVVVEKTKQEKLGSVCLEVEDWRLKRSWQRVLNILGAGDLRGCSNEMKRVVVRADSLGLPAIAIK